MSAPTATLTAGAGTITTTGEGNGLLVPVDPYAANARVRVGVAGTFSGATLAVRGKLTGLDSYYPIPGKTLGSNAPIADVTSITLTDSTNAALEFDASGCDAVEVWCPAGTLTAFGVEVGQYAAAGPMLNVINLAVSGAQAVGGNLAVTGTGTVTSTSAAALTVGANGATNPVLKVNANTASVATGVTIVGAAAAGGVAVTTISSGTNEAMTIDAKGSGTLTLNGTATGNVVFGAAAVGNSSIKSIHATGGIGYATGAGGTVTQASSRTTGVTINTVSGNIVLVSAAGSATPFSFTVTNSAVAAGDTVIVNQKSGTDKYTTIAVTAVGAGSFQLTLANASGTTTEQPVFNFNVIKGVAA